jgi:serine/threonine-protein kinase
VVRVFDVDETPEGAPFLVMERLEGTTLRALVRKQGPLSRRSLLPLVRGIGAGLAAAHALGLAHGHLHGGQVMVHWPEEERVRTIPGARS